MNDYEPSVVEATVGETGEVLDVHLDIAAIAAAVKALEPPKQRKPPKPKGDSGFIMVWIPALLSLRPSPNQMWGLMYLTEQMDRKGHVRFQLAELARVLNVSTQSTWRIVDSLVKMDALRRVERGHFIVNPDLMWRGSLSDRTVAKLRWFNGWDGVSADVDSAE